MPHPHDPRHLIIPWVHRHPILQLSDGMGILSPPIVKFGFIGVPHNRVLFCRIHRFCCLVHGLTRRFTVVTSAANCPGRRSRFSLP